MEFWFVRHGETVDNINHVLQGHQPGKLSEQGISQAKLTGVRLAQETFSEIYCSDLGRCKETLECVIAPFKNKQSIKITYSPLIRERGFGVLENLPTKVYREMLEKSGVPPKDFKPKGGESYKELEERAEQFFEVLVKRVVEKKTSDSGFEKEEIREESKQNEKQGKISAMSSVEPKKNEETGKLKKILVISHKGFLTELINAIQNKQKKDMKQDVVVIGGINNCSVTVVRASGDKEEGVKFDFTRKNDVSHLN